MERRGLVRAGAVGAAVLLVAGALSPIGETKDPADAVLAMAKTRADYFQAVFNYQMGGARFDNAAGRDVEEIRALVEVIR